MFASTAGDRTTHFWATDDYATKRVVKFNSDANLMFGVRFSPDSKFITTGYPHGVKVFKVDTAARGTGRFFPTPAAMHAVAFSPDGRAVAAGGDDGLVRIWPFRGDAMWSGQPPPESPDPEAPDAGNAVAPASPNATGFATLFNGRDLTGWDGDPAVWSAVNGVIRGTLVQNTSAGKPSALVWRGGALTDFELQFSFRLTKAGNAGVYYHATELPNFDVGGYQFEIMRGGLGFFFEVGNDRARRNLQRINSGIDRADEWHAARIIVSGRRVSHILDGRVLFEFEDTHPNAPLSGVVALEVTGGPASVDFKDLRLKRGAVAAK